MGRGQRGFGAAVVAAALAITGVQAVAPLPGSLPAPSPFLPVANAETDTSIAGFAQSNEIPEGTQVYFQWMDRDGAVSPVYRTEMKRDGDQTRFAFDTSGGFVDRVNKKRVFTSKEGQRFRVWFGELEGAQTNNRLLPYADGADFGFGEWVRVEPGKAGLTAGSHVGPLHVRTYEIPDAGYMVKPRDHWVEDNAGPHKGQAQTNWLHGTVAFGTDGRGGTAALDDYRVVVSVLDPAWKDKVGNDPASTKHTLEQNPEAILTTVSAPIVQGRYTVRLPQDAQDADANLLYAYVEDPNGKQVPAVGKWQTPQFEAVEENSVDFALPVVVDLQIRAKVADQEQGFNMTDAPARPGDAVQLEGVGNLPHEGVREIWYLNGLQVSGSAPVPSLDAFGNVAYKVPENVNRGDVFTAVLITKITGREVAATSIIIETEEQPLPVPGGPDAPYEPPAAPDGPYTDAFETTFKPAYVRPGQTAVSVPPLATLTRNGERFSNQPLPEGTTLLTSTPGAEIITDAGGNEVVRFTPQSWARVGETINVEVLVTYPDKTTSTAIAPFTVIARPLNETAFVDYEQGRKARPGQTVSVRRIGERFNPRDQIVQFLPDKEHNTLNGWRVVVDEFTGDLRATAPQDPEPLRFGTLAFFNDGSHRKIETVIGVADPVTDSERYQPTYERTIVEPGALTCSAAPKDLPKDASVTVTSNGGVQTVTLGNDNTVCVTVPKDAAPATVYTVALQVNYADDSVEALSAEFEVESMARALRDLTVELDPVHEGSVEPVLPKAFEELPKETTFGVGAEFTDEHWDVEVNKDSGALRVQPRPEVVPDTKVRIPVVVSLPDTSQAVVAVEATATASQRSQYNPSYTAASVNAGARVRMPLDSQVPATFSLVEGVDGVSLSVDKQGTLTAHADPTALPGPRSIKVAVSYSDGSRETITALLTVKTSQGNEHLRDDETLNPLTLTHPAGAKAVGAIKRPAGAEITTFDLQSTEWGARITPAGVFTATIPASVPVGEQRHFPVNVIYADGSTNTVTITVKVAPAQKPAPKPALSSAATILPIVLGLLALVAGGAYAFVTQSGLNF